MVILNALRALSAPRAAVRIDRSTDALLHRFSSEHDALRAKLTVLADAAADLARRDQLSPDTESLARLREADDLLESTILPHEHAEEALLYPVLAKPLGSGEATATMSRMHAEIDRLARRVHAHRLRADRFGHITSDQQLDVIATLYGLYAMLRLHFSQEQQSYFALASPDASPGVRDKSGQDR
ncbi:hemerythrin domain-containing protein [Gordonia westfalica]|uniref:Hemerythrin HHE cation binding domain-containing protein n=1 Tax=Gordonia westfalica TaxID=158898 RepID=A0A1H2H420_9ACTN|nr:hemerythrin domain-containing protein [Gordonia westfalica]SDU26637.1 Hemerythrin HHE cation binding domain-containing protein [Gordonia westfalica]